MISSNLWQRSVNLDLKEASYCRDSNVHDARSNTEGHRWKYVEVNRQLQSSVGSEAIQNERSGDLT